MNLDKHTTIARLRSAIRSQESASRGLRAQINALRAEGPSTGQERSRLHRTKQEVGRETRDALLALAMVRGRAYRDVEQKTNCPPQAFGVAERALGVGTVHGGPDAVALVRAHIKEVTAWFDGGPSPVTHEPAAVAA